MLLSKFAIQKYAQILACMFLLGLLFFTASSFSSHAYAAGLSSSAAVAKPINNTTTKTRIIPLPSATCAALEKQYPQIAKKIAGNCFITATSTTTFLPNSTQVKSLSASSCPSGSANHAYSFQTAWWFGAEMVETFTWHGNCSTPTVSGQRCNIGIWTYFPATGVNNSYCNNWSSGNNTIVAEGDYYISFAAGAGNQTEVAEAITSGQSTEISDTYTSNTN